METMPFEIGETAHALRKAFDRLAVGLGVTRAQWKVLFRPNRNPGLRQVELADLSTSSRSPCAGSSTGSRRPARRAHPRPRDRRAWRLHITARSQPLIEKLKAVGAEPIDQAFAGIDPKDIEITRRVLAGVRENAGRRAAMNRASNQ